MIKKKVALIGGAKNIFNKKNYIDDYDVVIRINNLPKPEYYDYLGKRCDLLMLSTGPINLLNDSFLKVWMTPKNRFFTKYAKGEIFHYPEDMWKELYNILNSRPSTGAMSLHFLKNILSEPDITLFGFDHGFMNVWYQNEKLNYTRSHNTKNEKEFFSKIIGDKIRYSS